MKVDDDPAIANPVQFEAPPLRNGLDRVIGIAPDLTTYEGYDSQMSTRELTLAQRLELADYMIELWTRFKDPA